MTYNFDELLLQGKSAAENVVQNRSEIEAVLDQLQRSLSQFLSIPIKFDETIEYVQDPDPLSNLIIQLRPKEKTGFNIVCIHNEETKYSKGMFKIKLSDDVYPVTLVREKNRYVADNKSEFEAALGEIVSNSQFHLKLNSFRKKVEEILAQKTEDISDSE
jgi:hypothetical protein